MTQSYADLYGFFGADFDQFVQGLDVVAANGVVAGLAVSQKAVTPDMSVDVASGRARADGTVRTFSAVTNVVITAADPTNPRKDLIVVNAAGTLVARAGTAAAADPSGSTRRVTVTPDPVAFVAGDVLLAEVWVAAGVTSILNADISDRRSDVAVSPFGEGMRIANEFPGASISEQITNAMTDLPSTGGTVLVRPGTYSTSASVTTPNVAGKEIILEGFGDATEITFTPTTGTWLTLQGNDDRFAVRKMKLIGSGVANTSVAISLGANLVDNVSIHKVNFEAWDKAVVLSTGTFAYATNVVECIFKNCDVGIETWSTFGSVITRCFFDDVGTCVGQVGGDPFRLIVSFNTYINPKASGRFYFAGLNDQCSVYCNTIDANLIAGVVAIEMTTAGECVISNNVCYNLAGAGSRFLNIATETGTGPSVIIANTVRAQSTAAADIINITGTGQGPIVIGNVLRHDSGISSTPVITDATGTALMFGNVGKNAQTKTIQDRPFRQFAADPADGLVNGAHWYRTDLNRERLQAGGATKSLAHTDDFHKVARAGTLIGTRGRINFASGGVSVTDDAVGDEIDIDIFPNFATLVPAAAVLPATGAPTLAQVDGTNVSYKVLDFADGSTQSAYWTFALPVGWQERDIVFKIRWRGTTAGAGNVVWDIAVLGRIEGELIDTAPTAFGNTTGDANAATLGFLNEFTITFAAASFDLAGYDLLQVRLQRIGAHANDTLAEVARLVEMTVELK